MAAFSVAASVHAQRSRIDSTAVFHCAKLSDSVPEYVGSVPVRSGVVVISSGTLSFDVPGGVPSCLSRSRAIICNVVLSIASSVPFSFAVVRFSMVSVRGKRFGELLSSQVPWRVVRCRSLVPKATSSMISVEFFTSL
ncbi:hypothetical protein MTO96_028110 [Rhipicephalus appendiculatus]